MCPQVDNLQPSLFLWQNGDNCSIPLTDPKGQQTQIFVSSSEGLRNVWRIQPPYKSRDSHQIAYDSNSMKDLPWSGEYQMQFGNNITAKFYITRGRLPFVENPPSPLKMSQNNGKVKVTPGYNFQTCMKAVRYNIPPEQLSKWDHLSIDTIHNEDKFCNITAVQMREDGKFELTLYVKSNQNISLTLKCTPKTKDGFVVSSTLSAFSDVYQ